MVTVTVISLLCCGEEAECGHDALACPHSDNERTTNCTFYEVENLAFEFFLQISSELVAYVFAPWPHDPLAKGGQTADQADIRRIGNLDNVR